LPASSTAQLIDGAAIGQAMRTELAAEVARLKTGGVTPGLAVVLVGDNPASEVYVRMKGKACVDAGFHHEAVRLGKDTSERDLLAQLDRLNDDARIHGILVQLPLPKQIDSSHVLQRVDPRKDVDGFHPINVGKVSLGDPTGFRPATPSGVQQLLLRSGLETKGRHAVVVGRSNIVGKPVAQLLLAENATVTITHSKTRDLPAVCRRADLLVAAIGRPEMIRGDWVKPGATVIDVGINRIDAGGGKSRLVGDVAFAEAAAVAGAITPVPGGVGPMTIACLLVNTVRAACAIAGLPKPAV
jgi:methylenetetrahydrofolate dehydrogenase (NADP+)/methenyltetrahydrofolate cyclohydrolase